MKIVVAPYKGWARALHISNGEVELVTTLEVGPRILRYAHVGGFNLFNEIPAQMGTSKEDTWLMRGGHRLWASPEDPAYTYFADNNPATHGIDGDQAWVASQIDPKTGLSYRMRICLNDSGSGVRIEHTVTNHHDKPYRLAPWALTVFAAGGTAIIPLPAYKAHPGDHGKNAADFAPQLSLALWPYFRFSDQRFTFGDRIISIKQDATNVRPAKIGACLPDPWAAYHLNNTLFVKRFTFDAQASYPDGGCNFESYTDSNVLELESLAGLRQVAPGQAMLHAETWSLHQAVSLPPNEGEILAMLAPLVQQTPTP